MMSRRMSKLFITTESPVYPVSQLPLVTSADSRDRWILHDNKYLISQLWSDMYLFFSPTCHNCNFDRLIQEGSKCLTIMFWILAKYKYDKSALIYLILTCKAILASLSAVLLMAEICRWQASTHYLLYYYKLMKPSLAEIWNNVKLFYKGETPQQLVLQ